jgi:hypothetical protein
MSTGRRSAGNRELPPLDHRNPGDAYLNRELERERRGERWLIVKSLVAIGVVAILVILRQLYFA